MMSSRKFKANPRDRRASVRASGIGKLLVAGGVIGALALSVPAASHAQDPNSKSAVRYNRESGKVKTKATLDTKFKKAQAQADKEKKRKVDMMTADQFARKKEAVAREIADEQIDKITRLIKATETSHPEYPELLFRLSDSHLEKKAYFDRQAGALYEKIYEAEEGGNKSEASQLKARQKKFEQQAKASSEDATRIYKVLVTKKQFAKYPKLDEAIYFYAFELGQQKRESEMQEAYVRLIRDFPTSKYIPNALLAFADYKFANNEIPDALRLYQRIVDGYKDSPVYAYALYKMAWCYLNPVGTSDPEYDASLEKFVATVRATLEGRAGNEANARQLRRDARRDMVKAYIHSGKPSLAYAFFTKVGDGPKKDEDMSRKMMELLGNAYFGEGMYVESSATYKKLQEVYDRDSERCEWQAAIVVNALATDNKQIQWKESEKLADYWDEYKDGKFSKTVKKKCRDEARDTVRQMATVWHDEAEKTRRADTYDLSEQAYRAYMKYFPKDGDAYEMNFYYAEILWAQGANQYNAKNDATKRQGLKKFQEAHDEFVRVLERKPDGKWTKEAAYAQMLAMKNALEYDETGGKSKACKTNHEGVCVYQTARTKKTKRDKDTETDVAQSYPETEYDTSEGKMIEAYDIYQKFVKDPKDKELPKIQYHRAKLMMDHNKFDEARKPLEQLITKFDGTIYSAWAAEMLVDLLVIRWTDKDNTPEETVKTSEDLEKWALKLQKAKLWQRAEADRLKENIPQYLAGIGWKKAEAFQEQGKQGDPEGYVKCGDTYVQLYNDHANHPRADTVLFNSARCYDAAYLVGKAITMRKTLLERHKGSEHYKQTLKELGEGYQAIAFFDKSADHFEQYADKYSSDEFTPTALQNAYLFRIGLGDDAKAQTDLNKYEDLYRRKDPEQAAKIFWSKYDLLEDPNAKLSLAREYIGRYGKKGGSDRLAVAHAQIGQILWRQSCGKEMLYDSCISIVRKRATAGEDKRTKAAKLRRKTKKADIPSHCGAPTQGLITVYPRDPKQANEAQSHFNAALKLAGAGGIDKDDARRIEDYKNAIGMSMVYSADEKYEEYLTVNIPEGLDFFVEEYKKDSGVPKWEREYKEQVARVESTKKRFLEFRDRKLTLAKDLMDRYTSGVKSSGSPYWVLAGAARAAIVAQNFADQLYRAEIPRTLKTEDAYLAYCDGLADQATPLEELANNALTYCLERSTEFQFFNDFSRMCEEELQQRSPDKYPATNELFGTSIYTDSRLDQVGVQTSLEGDSPRARGKSDEAADKGAAKEGL